MKKFENQQNVKIAGSVKELAEKSECVITMLPNNESVWSVYVDDGGILKYLHQIVKFPLQKCDWKVYNNNVLLM